MLSRKRIRRNDHTSLKQPPEPASAKRSGTEQRETTPPLVDRGKLRADSLTPRGILQLQSTVGNRAVAQLLATPSLGGGVLQRQGPAGPDPQALQAVSKMKRFQRLTSSDWQTLAQHARSVVRSRPTAGETIDKYLRFLTISWETVTKEQRAVFMALDDTRREKLRKDALKFSPLYRAIGEVHVPAGGTAAATQSMRQNVARIRSRPVHTRQQFVYGGSAAYKIATGDIAKPALVEPVRRAVRGRATRGARRTALEGFANPGLAKWVHARREATVKRVLKNLACGIGNLFAFALSRGDVPTAASAPPSIANAAAWLKKWTLDAAAGKRLLTSRAAYNPRVVLRELSKSKKVRVTGGRRYTRGRGSASSESRKFVQFMERRVRSAKLAATDETRVALVQGRSRTHSFLTYKDLDGVWRPMDVYLNLEDLAMEKYGAPRRYSKQVSTVYFVVDPKK